MGRPRPPYDWERQRGFDAAQIVPSGAVRRADGEVCKARRPVCRRAPRTYRETQWRTLRRLVYPGGKLLASSISLYDAVRTLPVALELGWFSPLPSIQTGRRQTADTSECFCSLQIWYVIKQRETLSANPPIRAARPQTHKKNKETHSSLECNRIAQPNLSYGSFSNKAIATEMFRDRPTCRCHQGMRLFPKIDQTLFPISESRHEPILRRSTSTFWQRH